MVDRGEGRLECGEELRLEFRLNLSASVVVGSRMAIIWAPHLVEAAEEEWIATVESWCEMVISVIAFV